jgi:glutamate-1-semialdehyde 2,1-aminomutase
MSTDPPPPAWTDGLGALTAELRERYGAARPRSRAMYDRAVAVLPGGNSRAQLYFPPFPFYVERAKGAVLHDVDGFDYVDFVNNYTSLVHGHASEDLAGALQRQLVGGTAFGAPTLLEIELAEEICARVPSVERVRFANSGTEATMYAIRTARAFTGRDDLIKVEGGYHGGFDSVQVSVKHYADGWRGVPEEGVPMSAATTTHVIPFDDIDAAFDIIGRVGHRTAALIVEPMQGSAGALAADIAYLRALRDITQQMGIVLIFDEVMTLRLGYGGAQETFGVLPDLTAMGKIVGGGLPIGAFGGREDIMAVLDPRSPGPVIHAGTFNANPVSMAAGLSALRRLTRERIEAMNARGDAVRRRINQLATDRSVPLRATGMGSVLQVHVGSEPPRSFREASNRPKEPLEALFHLLLADGIFIATRGLLNMSTALTDQHMADLDAAVDRAIERLQACGFVEDGIGVGPASSAG